MQSEQRDIVLKIDTSSPAYTAFECFLAERNLSLHSYWKLDWRTQDKLYDEYRDSRQKIEYIGGDSLMDTGREMWRQDKWGLIGGVAAILASLYAIAVIGGLLR